ncbi:hypothetical protein EDC65_0770 [Stella humosa]|uniref:Uncharacterized protein n=1 Tax=Stella humosa TaxID=94 RepID=A0A3N1MFY6_9PROT|nr:hypothetical protein [Stella humosa]ROQ01590.1 hypothetical protein EDC65_0770 [Stella humosa]BBK31970.1 hypothetical protein STHU_26040 [Stella humosa]
MIEDGRIFSLVAMLALLFFLSERMLPAGSPLRRVARIAAVALLGLGLGAAILWSILWLLGGGMSGPGR